MYIENVRNEKNFCILSNKDGKLIFLDNDNNVISEYPEELTKLECPLKSPLVVHLELTTNCGLKCKHCYISGGKPRKNEMSIKEWKNIIKQLKELEVLSVYFTGGDPLLYDGFIELINYASDIGLSCNLLTNGIEFCNRINLSEIPKEVFIVLSYDGIVGTKILRKISGDKILDVIKLLQNEKRAFAVQGVIFKSNISDMIEFTKFSNENRIDFSLNDILPIGRTKKHLDLLITENHIQSLVNLEKIWEKYRKDFVPFEYPYSIANPNIYESIADIVSAIKRPEPGLLVAYIRSDGFICADNYYAAENQKSKLNLRFESFSNIWQKSFKEERQIKNDQFGMCRYCLVLEHGGFCDLQNIAMSNYIYGNKNYCGVYDALKKLKIERAKI